MPQRPPEDQTVHLLQDSHDRLSLESASSSPISSNFTTCSPDQTEGPASSRSRGVPDPGTSPPSAASGLEDGSLDDGVELDDMDPNGQRPAFNRPTGGRSGLPLLNGNDETRGRTHVSHSRSHSRHSSFAPSRDNSPYRSEMTERPHLSRRSTMRSRSPREVAAAASTKRKYTLAGIFLVVSLISFCVQTELSAHIQNELGWDKAYCMMYFTHGSWIVLWPTQLAILRLQKRDVPWPVFWKRHKHMLKTTAMMIEAQTLDVFRASVQHRTRPVRYMVRVTTFITCALTVAGLSWYIAVSLTTPSDLTAIYNCSAFFAYVFSVPLLKEPLRLDKSIAVLIAILGVLVVAYGDTKGGTEDIGAGSRFFGNLIIGVGSVLYGFYEVLYKRYACPPEGGSPFRSMAFAITFGSCIGFFTLTILWIPLPILHFMNIERFELPVASTCWLILLAVLANATFSGSFLVLISLTSPVLSSVAALLTIFMVAIVDWFITGEPLSFAAIVGGTMIIVAFLGLTYSTYREMQEHEAKKLQVDFSDSDKDGDLESDSD